MADAGGGVGAVVGDLSGAEGVETVMSAVWAAAPDVDILCNTAGFLDGYARSLDTGEALWGRVFDVNVKAMFRLSNAVLPRMIETIRGVPAQDAKPLDSDDFCPLMAAAK